MNDIVDVNQPGIKEALTLWRVVTTETLQSGAHDLSARQLALLMTVYLDPDEKHTIRSLSSQLMVSKPAICRAVDYLGRMNLLKRVRDPKDRRNVFVERTPEGGKYLSEFAETIMHNLDKI